MLDYFGVRQLIGRATVDSRSHYFGFLCNDGGDGAHLFFACGGCGASNCQRTQVS